MVDEDFRVEMIGHATLRVQSGGRTLLTDPWLVDPILCNSSFHFPPLVHDPAKLAAETDAIFLSHPHPDHFSPPTLALFSRDVPIYLGAYRRPEFRDRVRRLGFRVIEAPFQETVPVEGTDLALCIVEHDAPDRADYDSAVVIRTPRFTVFENNDCVLRPEKYGWVRERFRVDYAFLGYSPASFFPIAFELEAEEKARLLAAAADRRYAQFVEAATLLGAGLAVPFASGLRFLHESALWKNVSFSSAAEAVGRLRAAGLSGEVMGPGDRIQADGSLRRVSRVLGRDEELSAIADHARRVQGWVAGLPRTEPPADTDPGADASTDLVARFRAYMLALWRRTREQLPGVRGHVIAYVVAGPPERRFYFDFSRPDDELFQWGEPPRYDLRYSYPADGLGLVLAGEIDWDELHFATDVSVHQVNYPKDFYRMLRSDPR